MKRLISVCLIAVLLFSACAKRELADMTRVDNGDYAAIVWEGRTYVPYCAISKGECGAQLGIVDGDKDDRVYEYKGYSSEEWIIDAYVMDSAMLWREMGVTDIPDGLSSEYPWN